MNFAKFQALVEHRTGFRTMEKPTATGEYFSDSCGDLYTFFLKVGPGDVIEDISYFTTGCGFGTATCSLLVELARGKTIDEALAITDADIEAALDGYPDKKKDYPERSRLALQADPAFNLAFTDAKARVRKMDLRFVEEADPTRQALLEIYASVVLKTPYNDFNTH